MLTLYVQAPFAVFRHFTAGWYRPTASFLTHSAAYGLILNLAGIESRRDDGQSVMTLTAYDLPPAQIVIGADPENPQGPFPDSQFIFQQLHNYPVGSSGKERKEETKGNKYNITPVRREFLSNLRAYIVFKSTPEIESRVRQGLAGTLDSPRYGLPFLGDNSFLVDKIKIIDDQPVVAHWFTEIKANDEAKIRPYTTRLTTWVDRQEMSKTKSGLFAPEQIASSSEHIPETAWVSINPPKTPMQEHKKPKFHKEKPVKPLISPPAEEHFQLKIEDTPKNYQRGLFDDD